MKLATFTHGGETRIGAVVGELVVDLSKAAPELPTNMRDFLVAGDPAMEMAREAQTASEHALAVVDVELGAPVANPGKILSLSFWRDEKAIAEWRNISEHRQAQYEGRQSIFSNYRIRIAGITRDYGMHKTNESPQDSKEFHA